MTFSYRRFLDSLLTCGGASFPKPRNSSQRPSGRPTVQLHVWPYPESLMEAPDPTGKGLRSTRRTPVPSARPPVTRLGCCLDLWPAGYQSEVLLTPCLGLISLLEQVTELRATFHLPDHCFVVRRWSSGTARWEQYPRQERGEGTALPRFPSMPSSRAPLSPPRGSLSPIFQCFMEASMHRQNWLTLRLLVGLNLQPLPEVSRWARELLPCNHRAVYTGNQPPSSGWAWVLRCFSCAQLFATPWTVPHQAPLSMGILPTARTLEWVAISSSRGSSWPSDWTQVSYVSCTGSWVLYHYFHQKGPPRVFKNSLTHITEDILYHSGHPVISVGMERCEPDAMEKTKYIYI